MNLLVFNCGSSSQSARVYQVAMNEPAAAIASFKARNVDTPTSAAPEIEWKIRDRSGVIKTDPLTHKKSALKILGLLEENRIQIDAVGHRFVHGGDLFQHTTRIDPDSLAKLQACFPLAPIHNPNSYSVIEAILEKLPAIPQYAVFDTAFHALLPEAARRYAIPQALAQEFGYHKYGFHGLSCQYVSAKAAELLGKPLDSIKLIICHLGTGGSSVTAFKDGHSVETSMGYSPLAGLVMSTRCGDLDPGILLDLAHRGYTAKEITRILNHESGLIGLSGYSSNLTEIIEAAEKGDENCRIAYEVYANRLKTYLGAFTWLLNGADVILFTDEIGVNCWKLRQKVCAGVDALGVVLDENANRNAVTDRPVWVNAAGSRTRILVLPTDEESVIMQEVTAHVFARSVSGY